MHKLHHIEIHTDSFFAGMLFPFVEDGTIFLLVVTTKNKYQPDQPLVKLPGGTGDRKYAEGDAYMKRLEEVLEILSFDRISILKILNQEYDRRAFLADHPDSKQVQWLLQTLVLECLEATGYYPADLDPWVVDVVERSEDHYQYFLEIKELWDRKTEVVKIPQADENFTPIDEDIITPHGKLPIMEFEEVLIGSHKRPVEFYIEHLKRKAKQARKKE